MYYGIHNNNGTDYVAGNAIVFLRDNIGDVEIPKEVKIFLEKAGTKYNFYVGKMDQNTKYYFDMVINSLQGDYNVFAEAKR